MEYSCRVLPVLFAVCLNVFFLNINIPKNIHMYYKHMKSADEDSGAVIRLVLCWDTHFIRAPQTESCFYFQSNLLLLHALEAADDGSTTGVLDSQV